MILEPFSYIYDKHWYLKNEEQKLIVYFSL